MDFKPGSERCILAHSNSSQNEKVLGLQGKQKDKLVQGSAFQTKHSTIPQSLMRVICTLLTRLTLIKAIVLTYLDDFLVVAKSEEECINQRILVLNSFQRAGFNLNPEKSWLIPSWKFVWLGIDWCSHTCSPCLLVDKAHAYS